MSNLLQESAFREAIERVSPHIHNTPVFTSRLLNEISKTELYFKCDNFQKGGSYKIRGATNAVLQLSEAEKARGVVTHSSGNFAAALTLAAINLGVKAYIVMPENAPSVKRAAVEDYGAEIITCPSTLKHREAYTEKVIAETGAVLVHPSNDGPVILGQATMTAEFLIEIPNLEIIVCPIGGGGVGAGACIAAHHLSPACKIIGAEPENASDAFQSMAAGEIVPSINPNTIADGLRSQLGDQNFPILHKLLDQIILVTEDGIIEAMRLVWERMKIIIEPSSAVTLAAILSKPKLFKGKKIGLIITGGNVSLNELPF
ncbi:MAG: threonine dehydratase [Saprospiraceae bacterium]|jgi:threonine dehydratase